jgi:tRNA pseudouridine38-40 synthase
MATLPANPRTLRLDVAYDGTAYAGWQVQPEGHGPTIQGTIEDKLAQLYANQPIRVHGSGRTDAGVHALGQVAHFHPPECPRIPLDELPRILNGMLPADIRIRAATPAADDFHARFKAAGKAYAYVLHCGPPNPFAERWSWRVPDCADVAAMRRAARRLLGRHDFSSFTVARNDIGDAERTLHRIAIQRFDERLCLTFLGDGFLYKMVRSLTAALVEVGRGRLSPAEVADILAARNRAVAPATAPARGLFLAGVFYDPAETAAFRLRRPPPE